MFHYNHGFFTMPGHVSSLFCVNACGINSPANGMCAQMVYALHMLEQQFLMQRLGPSCMLNQSHCTGRYRLATKDFEHMQVGKVLGDLAAENPEWQNWYAPLMLRATARK